MKIMVVGGGGREHAIIRKLSENPEVETIYALPGNAGIARQAACVPVKATDIDEIVRFARENGVDFAVVAPDDPLALGAVDALHAIGIPCFGPEKSAARIESSKAFAKQLMKKYHIPTAQFEVFEDYDAAIAYVRSANRPLVVKADGLALGKGVLICSCDRDDVRSPVWSERRARRDRGVPRRPRGFCAQLYRRTYRAPDGRFDGS